MRAKMLEVRTGEEVHSLMVLEMYDETSENRRWLLKRAGFPDLPGTFDYLLVFLDINECGSRPDYWSTAWQRAVHKYVERNFDKLDDGSVVDVDYIESFRADGRGSSKINV
jgi:hypothetical protein